MSEKSRPKSETEVTPAMERAGLLALDRDRDDVATAFRAMLAARGDAAGVLPGKPSCPPSAVAGPTPRTDAHAASMGPVFASDGREAIWRDFARQLERELAEARDAEMMKAQQASAERLRANAAEEELALTRGTLESRDRNIESLLSSARRPIEIYHVEPVEIYRTPGMVGVCVNGTAYGPETLIGALAIMLDRERKEALSATAVPTRTEHVMPRDEWEHCVLVMAAAQELLRSTDDTEEYNATMKLQQAMTDLEKIVGQPLFRRADSARRNDG